MSKNVQVKSQTWKRDSHGLFDQESKCLSISNVNVAKNVWLAKKQDEKLTTSNVQSQNEVQRQQLGKMVSEGTSMKLYPCDYLCRMDEQSSSLLLTSEDAKNLKNSRVHQATNEQLQYIVRSYEEGWPITSGDLVKLGRIKFFVRETSIDGKKQKADSNNLFYKNDFNCKVFIPESSDDAMSCRTCLDDCNLASDPLLTICRCTGSIKYMHLNCLKQWLKSKLHLKKSDHSFTQNQKNFSCELCTMPYPKSLKQQGAQGKEEYIDLLEYEANNLGQNYLVLETLNKENNLTGALHTLVFDQGGEVTIGRGSESHVRISDISVSRTHAMISKRDGRFWVRDNKSKFGTLVRANAPLQFDSLEDKHQLQFGRTIQGLTLSRFVSFSDILNNSQLLLEKEQQRALSNGTHSVVQPTLDQTQNIHLNNIDFMINGGLEMEYNMLQFTQNLANDTQGPNTQDKEE